MSAPERRAPCARPGPRGTIKGEYRERERERRDDTGGDPRAAEYPPVLRGQVHPSGGFCPQSASGEAGAGGKTVKRQEKAPASENADAGAFHLREIRLLTYRNRDNLVIILPDISHFIKTKLDQTEFSPNISCLKCAPKMRQKGGGWYGKYKENGGEKWRLL